MFYSSKRYKMPIAIHFNPQLTANNSQHSLSALAQLGLKHYFV